MKKNELITRLLDRKLASGAPREFCMPAAARNFCMAAAAARNFCVADVGRRPAEAAPAK